MKVGNVVVFRLGHLRGDMELKANVTEKLFEEFENIASADAVQAYYDRIFAVANAMISSNSITTLMGKMRFDGIPFRTYAQSFNFIESETVGIVIPCEANAEFIEKLKYGALSAKRNLQRYCASVSKRELDYMIKTGIAEQENGVYILSEPKYYNGETGLDINKNFDPIL